MRHRADQVRGTNRTSRHYAGTLLTEALAFVMFPLTLPTVNTLRGMWQGCLNLWQWLSMLGVCVR